MRVALDQYIFLITPAGDSMDTVINFEEKFSSELVSWTVKV